MEGKQKMLKKSKDMILEVPDYFTPEEMMKFFGSKKNAGNMLGINNLTKIDQNTSNISYDVAGQFKNRTVQISKLHDNNNIFEEDEGDLNEHTIRSSELLEDMFLKNQ